MLAVVRATLTPDKSARVTTLRVQLQGAECTVNLMLMISLDQVAALLKFSLPLPCNILVACCEVHFTDLFDQRLHGTNQSCR
jgi:hypothetical protein